MSEPVIPFCVWCDRMSRGGREPEVCGHLSPGMAEATQSAVERWEAAAKALQARMERK